MPKLSSRWPRELLTPSRPFELPPDLQQRSKLAKDRNMTEVLERYWQANKAPDVASADDAPPTPDLPPSPTLERTHHSRSRSISDGTALNPSEYRLSPHHPAWSLTELLDRFGPLIFPIHRAALLRRRILISCHAPVRQICDFGKLSKKDAAWLG